MRNILFVDDEQGVLNAMRLVFHKFRGEWRMVFACGPQAALADLAHEQFDAVVTDLAMPGMSGLVLLMRVRDVQPNAVRVVLSGNVEATLASVEDGVCHAVLRKPCASADVLACLALHLA